MTMIAVEQILPNPEQPRRHFDVEALSGLAQSIRENGVIQPLVVEGPFVHQGKTTYVLVDGERRLRAAQMAGLREVPVVVAPAPNGQAQAEERLVRALVANIQRSELGPVEEGEAFARLRAMGLSKNQIALKMGVSIARVTHRLQLLELEPEVRGLIAQGRLPKDQRMVEALLALPAAAERVRMAQALAERRVSVGAGVEACRRYLAAREEQTTGREETPGVRLAVKRAGAPQRARWDALAQVGRLPPWVLVEVGVRDTCRRCALADTASETVCRGCPVVELLVMLIGSAK